MKKILGITLLSFLPLAPSAFAEIHATKHGSDPRSSGNLALLIGGSHASDEQKLGLFLSILAGANLSKPRTAVSNAPIQKVKQVRESSSSRSSHYRFQSAGSAN